jgi:hypothetical protein
MKNALRPEPARRVPACEDVETIFANIQRIRGEHEGGA